MSRNNSEFTILYQTRSELRFSWCFTWWSCSIIWAVGIINRAGVVWTCHSGCVGHHTTNNPSTTRNTSGCTLDKKENDLPIMGFKPLCHQFPSQYWVLSTAQWSGS